MRDSFWFDQLHPQMISHLLPLICWSMASMITARKLPDIQWHSNNTIFDISNTEHVKRVHLLDRVTLLCPPPAPRDTYEHTKLYMVPREAYEQCVLQDERQLGVCSTPERQSSITLVFRDVSPLPSALTFRPGQSYFVITTSNGTISGMENTEGGLCAARNMRLKFDVLSADETVEEDNNENESLGTHAQPSTRHNAHHRGHHHHHHGHKSEQQQLQQQPTIPKSTEAVDSATLHHPPFLYVIHTAETPHHHLGGEEAAALGQPDDTEDGEDAVMNAHSSAASDLSNPRRPISLGLFVTFALVTSFLMTHWIGNISRR